MYMYRYNQICYETSYIQLRSMGWSSKYLPHWLCRPKVCYTYPGLEHMEDRASASRPPRDGDEKQTMGGDGGGT